MSEDEALRFFLITANNISKGLKNALQQKVNGYEKVLVYVIKCCADRFEQNQDHQYLRVAVFCVSMIDSILGDAEKVAAIKKQIKLNKTQKLFIDYPRITLFKELPMNVANILKNCPNFTENAENEKGGGCPLF
jgi:deoxyhypusine synthase